MYLFCVEREGHVAGLLQRPVCGQEGVQVSLCLVPLLVASLGLHVGVSAVEDGEAETFGSQIPLGHDLPLGVQLKDLVEGADSARLG